MNLKKMRKEILGYGNYLEGPYGKKVVTYTDYTASGKGVHFLEKYFLRIGETYANTHTEDDYTGRVTTQYYKSAKDIIKRNVNATNKYSVIQTSSGTTAAIDKLIKILGLYKTPGYFKQRDLFKNKYFKNSKSADIINEYEAEFEKNKPVVFISSYEHHSNEIQWRESFCEIVKINQTKEGLFDLDDLRKKVADSSYKNRKKIGSFSAASNVTGLKTPVYEIAEIMHLNNALVFFDFAASGPYVDINMTYNDKSYFDGIYLSMHKFLGGPGSSGLLILKNDVYDLEDTPTAVGGGTVHYVTGNEHKYLNNIEDREDAGTPGIMQLMRAAMALDLKDTIGVKNIETIEETYIEQAMTRLKKEKNVEILGNLDSSKRLAILSFNIKHKEAYLHQGFISTLLNDLFGIQSRAGCSCAAPYGNNLLKINKETEKRITKVLDMEINSFKPGWVRLNFHYTLDQETVDFLLDSISFIANYGYLFLRDYQISSVTGSWMHNEHVDETSKLNILDALMTKAPNVYNKKNNFNSEYKRYLKQANKLKDKYIATIKDTKIYGRNTFPEVAWFYHIEKKTN